MKKAIRKKASFKRGCKARKGKVASGKIAKKSKRLSSAAASTKAPSSPGFEVPEDEAVMGLPPNGREPEEDDDGNGEELGFKGFSLQGFPEEALPDRTRQHGGSFSYTVFVKGRDNGEVIGTVDVLLKKAAYYVKKPSPTGRKGTVSFKKCGGPCGAWEEILKVGGFV